MRAFVLVALAACGSKVNPEYCAKHYTDHRYCPWDASAVSDTAPLCLGSGTFAICVDGPTAPTALPADLDTDLSPLCEATQPTMWKASGQLDACFVAGTTVTGGNVVAHGGRPLVVVAADTITVTGLDVASHFGNATTGAGFDPTVCGMFARAPGSASNGGAGGAGGTFYGATGGGGGMGDGASNSGLPTTAVTMPTMLRGGCPGSNGGAGTQAGGTAGSGGGALYLLAGNKIDLTGATVSASGGGGGGGDHSAGGGGGGSGGMIVLVAMSIGASGAVVVANGGSGGAGGNALANGGNGTDPNPTTPLAAATGGNAPINGGNGGNGFAGPNAALAGADAVGGSGGNGGGGGGGGGGGYIQTNHPLATTMVSPSPVIM
jgi:hypothetical protein